MPPTMRFLFVFFLTIVHSLVKPLLTHAVPPLTKTMPKCCYPLALLLTSEEQLMKVCFNADLPLPLYWTPSQDASSPSTQRRREDSDTDLIIDDQDLPSAYGDGPELDSSDHKVNNSQVCYACVCVCVSHTLTRRSKLRAIAWGPQTDSTCTLTLPNMQMSLEQLMIGVRSSPTLLSVRRISLRYRSRLQRCWVPPSSPLTFGSSSFYKFGWVIIFLEWGT